MNILNQDNNIFEEMLHTYSNVIEQTSASIIITDKEGIIKYVNPRFSEITGYTKDEVLGKKPSIFKSGHTSNEEYQNLWDTISSGLIWKGNFYNMKKNGEMYWEAASITPVTNELKSMTYFIAIKVDITERKKLEDELLFANEIISNMEEGVYLISAKDELIVYTNPKFDRMFGYEKGELIGKHLSIINALSEKEPGETAKEIIAELKINKLWQGEVCNLRKNGTHFYSHATVSKYRHAEFGEVWISVHNDISERKAVEYSLKKLQKEQTILLDHIPAWVFFKDTENNFLRVNKTFADIMQMSKEQLEEKSLFDLYPYDEAESFWKDDKEVIKSGKAKINIIEPMQSPDGILWAQTDKIPYSDEQGNIIGIVGFTIDITERKKAEENIKKINVELKELNATKDKFFSIIAHDLKSPFQGLLGYSQILTEEYETLTEEERREFINNIRELTKSTYTLLDNLLLWSRIQAGKIVYNPDVFNIYREILPTIKLLTQTAANKEIAIENLIDKKAFVNADINMITTVIRNLISNAIKFTKTGGRIKITTRQKDKFLLIDVSDNGIGMDYKRLNNLFHVENSFSTKGTADEEGTGLGLILCKEMIKLNGGDIWVESEAGKGSVFSFSIPIKV